MKRLICCLALLACLSFTVLAAPVKLDGIVNVLKEYNDTFSELQLPKYESNNALMFADLHWNTSPEDQSVYLGLQYECSDHALEDGMTGVEVWINDELVGTVFADGTVTGVDRYLHELEGVFIVQTDTIYEITCEIRVGIKFWPDGDINAGVRILDFSGNPSNYYRQTVYTKPVPTTAPEKATAPEKSTTSRKTTTAQETSAASSSVTGTTVRAARTTAPAITASPKREATATTTAVVQPTVVQPAAVPTKKADTTKTTKPKTTKAKATTKAKETTKPSTKRAETTLTSTEKAAAAAAVTEMTTEATTSPTSSVAVSNTELYKEANKARIVGVVLVAVLLTAAIMSAVFLGMRQKGEPEPHTPQEEYDDFG